MKLLWASLAMMACACATTSRFQQRLQNTEAKFSDHIGFVLYDPATRKTLIEYNSAKYFTPASNTKIFTFYTALQILGDSLPALRYTIAHDSLIFWGTGDPSFLYREVYNDTGVYKFLQNAPQKLFFSASNFQTEQFGPGWAWDDYRYAFSSERAPFPIYGNLVEVMENPDYSRSTIPLLFSKDLLTGDSVPGRSEFIRDPASNQILFRPGRKSSPFRRYALPFHYSPDLFVELLADTLKKEVEEINYQMPDSARFLKGIPADSVYKVMMQQSDNFIAEQLLITCAGTISDTLKPEIALHYAMKNLLFDMPDQPIWVDGSGLSRYNLFTPRTIVRLWEKIYDKVPRERLFALLAIGGKAGTLKNWCKGDKPWIFGKTGSLSNNQTLSGFLLTDKGKILIFSFMNANFIAPTRDVRGAIEEILAGIRDKY